MGGIKSYDAPKKFKSNNESVISLAGEFPKCKGLYPDCPVVPSLLDSQCRTCPKTESLKKPKMTDDDGNPIVFSEEERKKYETIQD